VTQDVYLFVNYCSFNIDTMTSKVPPFERALKTGILGYTR